MAATESLYMQVVTITEDYLGPAAERFISRQVSNHLNKQPDDLVKKDLAELIDWIRLAMGLLTDNERVINEYVGYLQKLADRSHSRNKIKP